MKIFIIKMSTMCTAALYISPRVVKSLTNYCEEQIWGEDQMVIFIHNIQTEGGETSQGSREHFGIEKYNILSCLVMISYSKLSSNTPTLHLSEQYFRGEWTNQIYWTLFPFKLPQRKIVLFYVSSELVQLKETEQNGGSEEKIYQEKSQLPCIHYQTSGKFTDT